MKLKLIIYILLLASIFASKSEELEIKSNKIGDGYTPEGVYYEVFDEYTGPLKP